MNGIWVDNKPVNQWGDYRPGVVGSVGDSKRSLLTSVSAYWCKIKTVCSRYEPEMGAVEYYES